MHFLFVLRYDSFIKTLVPVINILKKDHHVDVILYKHFLKKNWINNDIRMLLDGIEYSEKSYLGVLKQFKKNYDIVTLGFTGGSIIPRFKKFLEKKSIKSKVVTGYIGALLNNSDFYFKKGIKCRSVSDLIFVPGMNAKEDIIKTGLVDIGKTKIVVTGLPRFDELYNKINRWKSDRVRDTILFLEQPTFPESEEERIKLVESLINLSEIYTDKKVIIKPRFAEKSGHAHRPKYLLQEIFKNKKHSDNICISYEDIYSLFPQADKVITLSSTGGLEALLANIPTYFVTDFCGNENKYGSDYFKSTNALVSFEDLYKDNLPAINYDAVKNIMKFDGKNTTSLVEALLGLE